MKTICLDIGSSRIEFVIHRSPDLGNSVDVAIALSWLFNESVFQGMPTILLLSDLVRLAEYIHAALKDELDYAYVPMNLGFEFRAYDNDDYVTNIDFFLLVAEPTDARRSYIGCRGPVLNDALVNFATKLKEFATTS